MKVYRCVGVFLIGLLTAILIYPFLHESGHSIATILVGGEVCEFQLFPFPYVTCEVSKINNNGMIIIGFSGMLFPFMFSWLIYVKHFFVCLIGLFLNLICIISFVLSLYGCIQYIYGEPLVNEDITKVIELCPRNICGVMITLIVLIIGIVTQIVISNSIQRCCEI